ncbi:MAG: AzlD domain-containing protein [Deferrisomatales bacterium]
MTGVEYVELVAAMGLVTYVPRWLPLVSLANRHLPSWFVRWLEFVPAAILAALLAPALLADPATRQLDPGRPEALVAVPTFWFAWRSRSLGGTVLLGMGLYWLAGAVL